MRTKKKTDWHELPKKARGNEIVIILYKNKKSRYRGGEAEVVEIVRVHCVQQCALNYVRDVAGNW